MTWQRKWSCHLKRLLFSRSIDTRRSLQMLFPTYLMEKIFKFPKIQKILLFSTEQNMNPKDSSYLPLQRCFFCLKPQTTYGLVTKTSSKVPICFTNCTYFMLQLQLQLQDGTCNCFFTSGASWRRFQICNGRGRWHPSGIQIWRRSFRKGWAICLLLLKNLR